MNAILRTFNRPRVLLPVAHAIEASFGVFDPGKVRALADAIRGVEGAA